MARIRHIAITAEDPFATAELFKKGFGLEEIGRGDSELAREVYLTDGYINVAIVCWKRTKETPNPYPEGYRPRPFRPAGRRPRGRGGAGQGGRRHATAAAAGRSLEARWPAVLREEIRSGRREVRSVRPWLAGCRGEEVSAVALELPASRRSIPGTVSRWRFSTSSGSACARASSSPSSARAAAARAPSCTSLAASSSPRRRQHPGVRRGGQRPRPGPRHDVPGVRAFSLAYRGRQRRLGPRDPGVPRARIDSTVDSYLQMMNLSDFRNHYPPSCRAE